VSPAEEGHRKVVHFLHYYRTSYSTNSTKNGTRKHRFVRYADDCKIYVRSHGQDSG